jgi:DNA-binding MarR family transcriptional regulator
MDADADAARVWELMTGFVERHSPRHRLRRALGDDLAKGRTKVMVLLMLGEGPRSLGDIAEAQRIDPPYATAIVDHLEARGLATRAADSADRRRKVVTLTPKGRAAAATAREIVTEPPAAMDGLSPDELTALAGILTRLKSLS